MNILLVGEESAGIKVMKEIIRKGSRIVAVMASADRKSYGGVTMWQAAESMGMRLWPSSVLLARDDGAPGDSGMGVGDCKRSPAHKIVRRCRSACVSRMRMRRPRCEVDWLGAGAGLSDEDVMKMFREGDYGGWVMSVLEWFVGSRLSACISSCCSRSPCSLSPTGGDPR